VNGRIRTRLVRCTLRMAQLCLAIAALIQCGCSRQAIPILYRNPADETSFERSKEIEVDFYVDSSISMRGFHFHPVDNNVNHFAEVLKKADTILRGGWDKVTVRYFAFGAGEPREVESISDFSSNPARFSERQTRIDHAITHDSDPVTSGAKRVRIILTDLFQDENEVGPLATLLNARYLQNAENAVAILGIRNGFAGPVYDLPGTIPKGGADTLPFYLLIAGPVMDVKTTIEVLENRVEPGSLPKDSHFDVVFSQRLVPGVRQKLLVTANPRGPGFTNMGTLVPGAKKLDIQQIAIYERQTTLQQKLYFTRQGLDVIRSPLLGLVPKLKMTVYAWKADPAKAGSGEWAPADSPEYFRADLSKLLSISETGEPLVGAGPLTIDGNYLRKGAVYLLEYDLLGEKGTVSKLDAWTLESNEARVAVQNHQFERAKDGSRPGKTPYLRFFVQAIADRAFHSDVLLARYYLYVKVL
jgi:hypothetical protein